MRSLVGSLWSTVIEALERERCAKWTIRGTGAELDQLHVSIGADIVVVNYTAHGFENSGSASATWSETIVFAWEGSPPLSILERRLDGKPIVSSWTVVP